MAMLYALLLMVVVVGVGALMFARTVAEIQHSGDDAAIVQTLLLARGAANLGGQTLQGVVRDELHEIVETKSSTTGRWSFGNQGSSNTSTTPNARSVVTDLTVVAEALQDAIDDDLCASTTFAPSTGGSGWFSVYFTDEACDAPLPSGVSLPSGRFVEGQPRGGSSSSAEQTYALPFVMVAEGDLAEYRRNVVLQGEYRFTVGRGSFAKYALFTNVHRMNSNNNSEIWFTEDTLFDGPVHTNNFFRFYRNPWFGGKVTSAGCNDPGDTSCDGRFNRRGAEFFDEGFIDHDDMNPNESNPSYSNWFGTHAPDINEVDWRAGFVPLPANNQDQEQAATDAGLRFGGDVESLRMWAADSAGNPLTPDGSGGYTGTSTYQYIEASTVVGQEWVQVCRRPWDCDWERHDITASQTFRYRADGLIEELDVSGGIATWQPMGFTFNGVIYVDGEVARLTGPDRQPSGSADQRTAPPALASFSQVTIAADDDIRITGDLKYEDPPCDGVPTRNADGSVTPANCDNLNAVNVLGIYTQEGDIEIGNDNDDPYNAPDNVAIHGVLMTSSGRVQVENYDRGDPRGAVNLLGGIIEYYYGAFGTFNSNNGTQSTGYDRKFTYDKRMSMGIEPPYFPTVTQDGVRDVIVFSYGQREQIY